MVAAVDHGDGGVALSQCFRRRDSGEAATEGCHSRVCRLAVSLIRTATRMDSVLVQTNDLALWLYDPMNPSVGSLRMDPAFAFILWRNKITQTQSEQYGNAVQYQRGENPNIVAH
jgi:hypothetical protein